VAVLANGPSLKEVLPKLTTKEFENIDFIAMNFFAFDDVFFQIKPKHYCLADPTFFQDSFKKEEVFKLFKIFQEKIDWDLTIYLPNKISYNKFLLFSKLTNSYLHYIHLNAIEYRGYKSFRYFFYKTGLSMPRSQTVANMAIYVGINNGYGIINLYGVDHTFFDSLCINERNELCNKNAHFYGEAKLKPLIRTDNYLNWKIADYLEAISYMFKSHDLLADYAKSLGVKIVNCTNISMIDSYERK
jgi:hypothetical protein